MATAALIENKAFVPKEFNKISRRYDIATKMSQGYQDDLDASARRMNLRGDEKLLDLCCGTGKSTMACLKFLPNGTVTGVDNSEGMLLEATRKLSGGIKNGKATFILKDAMHLDFADNTFDAVYMAYGLRNMPNYEMAIKGIHRVLKPGGKICIHDYSLADNFFARAYWAILGYGFIVPFCTVMTGSSNIYTYLVKSVLTFLSPGQIKGLLENNGFETATTQAHASWRKPILHSVIAVKKS